MATVYAMLCCGWRTDDSWWCCLLCPSVLSGHHKLYHTHS